MNSITSKILNLLICILLTGCVYNTGPKNNQEFANVADLQAFTGTYNNAGEPSGFLSDIIWPGELLSRSVVNIEVKLPHQKVLYVAALDRQGGILKESFFKEGKDFKTCDGRICLKNSTRFVGGQAQDPMLGIDNEYFELGLDRQGSGKFRSGGTAVGILYMIIPIAVSGKQDMRFAKIREK